MKIGELSRRIFSFIKAGHRDIAMSPPSALAKSIAALRFKILTKIKIHGSKFGFHTGWSILKNVIMNHLSNHFQKGILFLIVIMLLGIPSIRVYSLVGNYQDHSMAISANNNLDPHKNKDRLYYPGVAGTAVAGVLLIVCIASILASIAIIVNDNGCGLEYHSKNQIIHANYEKHDFSEFDN